MPESKNTFRAGPQTWAILEAINRGDNWGTALIAATGASMSTVYRNLSRLREHGWVVRELEPTQQALAAGRPERHLYRLTETAWLHIGQRFDRP